MNAPIHNLARIILTANGHALLAETYLPSVGRFFFVPGGHIEYGESIFQTISREMAEETNLSADALDNISVIGVHEHCWNEEGIPHHEIAIITTAALKDGSPTTVVSKESHLTFKWIELAALDSINMLPKDFKTLIPKWLETKESTDFFATSIVSQPRSA